MAIVINRGKFISSGQVANGTGGGVIDGRACGDRHFLWYQCSGNGGAAGSAIFDVLVSYDSSAWTVYATLTATATQTGAAQLTGYFPYVAASARIYSAAGGSGELWAHLTPMPRMGS